MKLKTLKDIGEVNCPNPTIEKKELKQEAIKWVNGLSNVQSKGDTLFKEHGKIGGLSVDIYDYEQDDASGMKKFIEHFFNLTEEDLKKGAEE